jgi:hypothetical protein
MKLNPILSEISEVEKQFLEWHKESDPSSAYLEGIAECAGRFFVPSKKNLTDAKRKLETILKRTRNKGQLRVFKSYWTWLQFNEPYMVPTNAAYTFFIHLVKEGIVPEHLMSLARQVDNALDAYADLLADRKWCIEIRIITCQAADQLTGILDTILAETKDEDLKRTLTKLKEKASKYRKLYEVEGIKTGDFSEVYPILQKTRGKVKRKNMYPKLLADEWGYPETAEEIEAKAKSWLKRELPELKKVTHKIAKIYGVKPSVETIDEELNKRKGVPKQQAIQFVKQAREVAKKVFETNIVKVTPKYETRVIETPSYLVTLAPTALLMPFDCLTAKPFNLFFVTTDPRFSPSSNIPDLVQLLLHEEYGHAVNFSNTATRFAADPAFVEILLSFFSNHISDGISFHREFEFVQMLKILVNKKKTKPEESELLRILSGESDTETMLLENEFRMLEWRILRFLRAIFDVRINMEKQSVADFVEWAHKETGLSKKMIYNQTWIFLTTVGYAPCYSIAGDRIRALQQRALKKGISQVDFNTYVSSLGFPAREIFEKRVIGFINKHAR